MRRYAICPRCHTKVECEGNPGEEIFITCPKCKNTGFIKLPKQQKIDDVKVFTPKEKLVQKKIMIIGSIAIITVLLLTYIVIPLAQGNIHLLVVLSGSMRPTLKEGDIVVNSFVEPNQVKTGDIITFTDEYNPKNCITHRVVEVLKEHGIIYFRTKGDANKEPDIRLVKSSRLIGKVVFIIPALGYLPVFAKTPLGLLVLIILPGVAIILNEIWRIIREIKKNKISVRKT